MAYNPYMAELEKQMYENILRKSSGILGQVQPQAPGLNNPRYKEVAPLLGDFALMRKKRDDELPLNLLLEPGYSTKPAATLAGLAPADPTAPVAAAAAPGTGLKWLEIALRTAGANASPGLLSLLGGRQRIPMAPAAVVGTNALQGFKEPEPSMFSLLSAGRRSRRR